MSEAWGSILIKASDELVSEMAQSDDGISWDLLVRLAGTAGIDSLVDKHSMLSYSEGNEFPHEGIERADDFVEITIFGDEWMYLIQALVKLGAGIEVYGSIAHEYGYTEYYALNNEGKHFFATADYESGEDIDEEALQKEWLSFVPADVQSRFPSVFSSDEDDYDDEDDD